MIRCVNRAVGYTLYVPWYSLSEDNTGVAVFGEGIEHCPHLFSKRFRQLMAEEIQEQFDAHGKNVTSRFLYEAESRWLARYGLSKLN